MSVLTLRELFSSPRADGDYDLRGWLRSKRQTAQVLFLVLYDGTTASQLQAVGSPADYPAELLQQLSGGAAVRLRGRLRATPAAAQPFELVLTAIELIGAADPNNYPLQPKAHSYAFLRTIAHLRPRTATFAAVFRLRAAVSHAVHCFFRNSGFFQIHPPIIAAADAEGAGEMFALRTDAEPDTSAFFGRPARLSVSGQLEADLLAMGLSRVYTFAPTFRAENSNTTRHLSEFWMIEPEAAFFDLNDCVRLAEELLRAVLSDVLKTCGDDLLLLERQREKLQGQLPKAKRSGLLREELMQLAEQPVAQLTYTEAFERLQRSKPQRRGRFVYPIEKWGQDLQAEHEQELVGQLNGAVLVRDYPADSKAFYMRENDDHRTVAAMDLLVPRLGELIGGSQREERLASLEARMQRFGMKAEDLQWYLDTRRYGSVPHSGFGLGFERLMQLITGMDNIRDVIPFPRAPQQLDF